MVTTSGQLPDNTGIQCEISKYGGGGAKLALSFLCNSNDLTSSSTYAFSNFDFGFYNFMEDNFNIYSASYRIGTFIYQ